MKAYEFLIWKTSLTGGWAGERRVIVHANNVKKAQEKLLESKEAPAESEWIYKITVLGTVKKVVETYYEYTPLTRRHWEGYGVNSWEDRVTNSKGRKII